MNYNMNALREIEVENNRYCNIKAHSNLNLSPKTLDKYAIEHENILKNIIAKYEGKIEIVDEYPNGICLYRITDKVGNLIAEYHGVPCVGNKIRAARLSAGLTQKELSDLVGITYQVLQRYEYGTFNPPAQTLKKLADALNCKMEDLI